MRGCCDDPDVHLICINDFSSLTVYSNLLIMNLPLPMYVLPVVLCIYVCHVQNKGYLLTYLLTYLLKLTPSKKSDSDTFQYITMQLSFPSVFYDN